MLSNVGTRPPSRDISRTGAIVVAVGVVLASACAQVSGLADFEVVGDEASSGAASSSGASGGDGSVATDGGASSSSSGGDGDITAGDGSTLTGLETPVFFLHGKGAGQNLIASPGVVKAGGAFTVGCDTPGASLFERQPTGPQGLPQGTPNGPYRSASITMRAFTPPNALSMQEALNGSKFVYTDANGALLLATAQSSCQAAAPVRIDQQAGGSARPIMPRFSPNGQRVAFFLQASSDISQLVTVGVDGKNAHVVRQAATIKTERGNNNAGFWTVAPMWLSDSDLVWIERSGSGQNQTPLFVVRGMDVASTSVSTNGQCAQFFEELALLDPALSRVVRVSSPKSWSQDSNKKGNTNISIQNGLNALCNPPSQQVTNESQDGSTSRDVAVSPTKTAIAFASNMSTPPAQRSLTSPLHIYVATIDSPTATSKACSGIEQDTDDFGPQWIEQGKKLIWTHSPHTNDHESIYVADVAPDGTCTNVHPLLVDTSDRFLIGANAGTSCALVRSSSRRAGSLEAGLLAALALSAIGRRRRRR